MIFLSSDNEEDTTVYDEQVMAMPGTVAAERTFVSRVYTWMFIGLLITGLVAAAVAGAAANNPEVKRFLGSIMIFVFLAELGLVFGLVGFIRKLSAGVAAGMFVVYSALTGLMLSMIFAVYTPGSIFSTFLITSCTFAIMAIIGHTTKRDLTSIGHLCFMALIGLIIASVVNMFVASEGLYWLTSFLGIPIFVGLMAYHTQRIKQMSRRFGPGHPDARKYAVVAALTVYLDFINLFLILLRFFGRRR